MITEDLEIQVDVTQVYEKETPELDCEFDQLFATPEERKTFEFINVDYRGHDFENEPMPIELLNKMITEAALAGATHISIDYHCDHVAYKIEGLTMKRRTEDVIKADSIKATNKILLEKRYQIEQLKQEIKDIETE